MASQVDSKVRMFWSIIAGVVALDVVTKWLAVERLTPQRFPHEVIGEWVRLTLVYNPGAAFGLHVGGQSRWVFLGLTIGAIVILWRLFMQTESGDRLRTLALALVFGGAVGNLIDRVRGPQGVVDFLDIGIGAMRWPTFNVADMAVSTGAIMLAVVLWNEDKRLANEGAVAEAAKIEG